MDFKCRLGIILAERKNEYGKEYNMGNFALRVGISGTTLSQIVNEKSLPRFDVAYKIAEELDLKIEDIWVRIKK